MPKYQSESEKNGIENLLDSDIQVLSVGISTGGEAEIKMAKKLKNRRIVATTLDDSGLETTRKLVEKAGLSSRIKVKIEDVSGILPYDDETFDYIYARLVLHYLPNDKLQIALKNLHRITKRGGRMFVVVRSAESDEAKQSDNIYNSNTGLTTYRTADGHTITRYFHKTDSITKAVVAEGWEISYIKQYDEMLNASFNRRGIWVKNNVIELLAKKP